MPWTWTITKIDDEGEFLSAFGQITFNGAYVTAVGGDGGGTIRIDTGSLNTASLPVFLSGQTALHATRPPYEINIQSEAGTHIPVVIPGTGATNFKIKQIVVSTGAELASGAYPAAVTGAVFNYLLLKFKKNV